MKRFLFCLLVLWICGCSKLEESPVPNWRVYINIDLRFQDRDLVGTLSHKSITEPRTANEYIGYSGVLVICGISTNGSTYYAYDLCCPNEVKRNIRIEVDDTGTKAICHSCGAEFEIAYGTGTPANNVSHYPLRCYQVIPRTADRQEWVITNMN